MFGAIFSLFVCLLFSIAEASTLWRKTSFVSEKDREGKRKRVKKDANFDYGWLFDSVCVFQSRIRSSFHVRIKSVYGKSVLVLAVLRPGLLRE